MSLSAFVPQVRRLDIILGGRPNDHRIHSWRVLMRSSTSSSGAQARGAAGGPSLSNSSILRSSSSRCASVSGIASGVSYRLSQISSRSSRRCSTVRVLISIAATPIFYPEIQSLPYAKISRRPLGSGTGSPNSFAASIHNRIASCALARAPSCVGPCAEQPGSSGTSATKAASSSLQYMMTSYLFIRSGRAYI